ncbi:hypothetical protein [Paenibacillus campi]|uniref:hypothetical protein n=1 Tax=Paenibacillus campi TaxID=3106031 RepID=UPI002AFFAC46|nr:hypothetical protein [Paenibacillus sp. SGZ-1009]
MDLNEFKRFGFFLGAYSVTAENYQELLEIVEEFRDYEGDPTVSELILELLKIQEQNKWKETQDFIIEHALRKYDLEEVEQFINDMLTILKGETSEEV